MSARAINLEPVTIEGRRVAKGDRLKVLEKKGGKVRVRDDRGNDAMLDEAESDGALGARFVWQWTS